VRSLPSVLATPVSPFGTRLLLPDACPSGSARNLPDGT